MITLTESAIARVKKMMAQQNAVGLNVGVKRSGCSGLSYTLSLAKQQPDSLTHLTFNNDEVCVFVPQKDHFFLDGLRLDYVKVGLNESFKFDNPRAVATCGCGTSFSTTA